MKQPTSHRNWTDHVSEEESAFIKRFVLASGSLKEMAAAYSVSYPTVRLRLDRLIAKIEIYEDQEITSEFERFSRALHADCKIDGATLKLLLREHEKEMEKSHEVSDRDS